MGNHLDDALLQPSTQKRKKQRLNSEAASISPQQSDEQIKENASDVDEDAPSTSGREAATEASEPQQHKKVLSAERLAKLQAADARRGVVYVSRMPPHMKPMKLKQLLSQYGEVLRVYCTPEDSSLRKERKKKGGKDTGKNFVEGWVEFADKRIAKRVANTLNGKNIGGKRRSKYFHDLWSLKYLRKFKWDHLTEEIAYEKAVREQRLAAEISVAKRERDFYLSRVDKAKAVAAISQRRAAKAAAGDEGGAGEGGQQAAGASRSADKAAAAGTGAGGEAGVGAGAGHPAMRHYGQRRAKADPATDEGATQLADDVLLMVAARKRPRAAQ